MAYGDNCKFLNISDDVRLCGLEPNSLYRCSPTVCEAFDKTCSIEDKIELIVNLTDSIDGHIWEVFDEFTTINKVKFNSPSNFIVRSSDIYFEGTDGCMGCYDPMSLVIPIEFFTNREEEFIKLKEELKQIEEDKNLLKELETKKVRKRLYDKLKKEFES